MLRQEKKIVSDNLHSLKATIKINKYILSILYNMNLLV